MNTEKFYVYEWFNTDTKEVFYVGKGTRNRYRDLSHRNKNFLDYVNNNNVSSRIVKYFNDEEEAYKYEKELTDEYRKTNQCKCCLIDGGYGGYSNIWTEEMKIYMSKYNPMKQQEQKQRMSIHNPMKDPNIKEKKAASGRRPVIIDGIEYAGINIAAKELGVSGGTIANWCNKGISSNGKMKCYYKDTPPNILNLKPKLADKKNRIKVRIDGEFYYDSMGQAAKEFFNVSSASGISWALKHNKPYYGHKVEYANQQPNQ